MRPWVMLAALFLPACSVAEINLEGKRCPCAPGYVCDTATNVCVASLGGGAEGGGAPDAASDARPDARRDSGPDALSESGNETGRDAAADATCDASTQSDPNNCGVCAHSCGGGGCEGGLCQPVVLASGAALYGMALDDSNVYWTATVAADGGTDQVAKCAKAGCGGAPTVLATVSILSAYGIATDGANVYWVDTTGSLIESCKVAGCGGKPSTFASGQSNPYSIALNATNVFWTTFNTTGAEGVESCALGGCPSPTPFLSMVPANVVVADDKSVFFAGGTSVSSCAASGCKNMPSVLASGLSSVAALAFDTARVYWLDAGMGMGTKYSGVTYVNGSVMSCPRTACAGKTTTIAMGLTDATQMVADATDIYWVSGAEPLVEIFQCSSSGCAGSPRVIAQSMDRINAMAMDAKYLYWGEGTALELPTARVVRLAR